MMPPTLVDTLNAQKAVVAQRIDAVYLGDTPPLADHIIDFEPVIATAAAGFVGRDSIFAALDRFCHQHANGYVDIGADAGLGKTALAAEITRRYQAIAFFANASRGLTHPHQFLAHAAAALIARFGLDHDHLPARAGEDATFLATVLGEAATRSASPVFLVVDALDEADRPPAGANPLLLPADLPPSVYIVVTRRPAPPLMTSPSTPVERSVLRRDDPEQQADIRAHIADRLTGDAALAERLAAASDGNFMYLSYVLADLAGGAADGIDLDALPIGLSGYYEQFWAGIQATMDEGWADWDLLFRPTIERLAVAAEAVDADWLAAQIGRPAVEIRQRALRQWGRLLSREQRDGSETWRIVHRSFSDFLADKLDLRSAHLAVVDRYLVEHSGEWSAWDDYGLRHAATHLSEAARRSAQPDRHAIVDRLVGLVTDAGYQGAHLERLHDPRRLGRDLEAAVMAVAGDDDARAPLLALRAALTLHGFRREQRQPAPIFELARRGDAEAAARRLDMFALDVDRDWYQAVLLTIAWLAAAVAPVEARRLRDRVATEHPSRWAVQLLLQRVDSSLRGGPGHVVPLPAAPPPDEAVARVDRLGGSQGASFLASELGVELGGQSATSDVWYLADDDGPLLVATAVEDPGFGEPLLQRYVAIHSAYGYREYRQGSLMSLLQAVARHPSDDWVRTWAAALAASALAPNRGDFTEGLGFAALLVRSRAGDAAADAELAQHRRRAQQEIADLASAAIGRGGGDTWGIHKRRAAALAEVTAQLPSGAADATALLSAALNLRYGFAGFSAPACLALAEAIEIAEHDHARVEDALAAASRSAHNIQDETFCARTTARINALRLRWWAEPVAGCQPVDVVAERLLHDSAEPEFTALHVVGEQYSGRDPFSTTPLSPQLRSAQTLDQLAATYSRPLVDVLRVNPGRAPQQVLDEGTPVNIPDPGFPPLLAARLAGRALADPALSHDVRVTAIGMLVPVAAGDTTALHTVLARLLTACGPADPAVLATLADLAERSAEEAAPDAVLAGRLTLRIP